MAKQNIGRLRQEFPRESWKKWNTYQLIANSQLLKPFIEPILLIWMIVIRCSWNFERPPSSGIFRCCNYFNMVKKITHRRKHSFFDSKRSWIDRYNWKKYLIDNSEAYSEPSLTFTMEIFPNIFNKSSSQKFQKMC